jgi:haloacetate dehalogenase
MFARTGGEGPPLLLLHGYTQTGVMWHRVAPALAERFAVVIPDLPGYGWSAVPEADPLHAPYDKRSMAKIMVEIMEALGHVRFRLAGHDRGGRVAYRLALDHAGRVERLATLDIVPTYDMWQGMDRNMAMKVWHWPFLAQPSPLPEMLIGKAPVEYLEWKMASWTKAKNLSAFDPRALDHYRMAFADPLRIHAHCEDYRAGAAADLANDEADRQAGNMIACPMLALWGGAGIANETGGPLAIWQQWARNVRGQPIDSGHFLTEENPEATARALLEFFTE